VLQKQCILKSIYDSGLRQKRQRTTNSVGVSGNIPNLWTTCVCSTTSHTIGLGSSAGDTRKYTTKNVLIYLSTCKMKK
jgi:hypothetical protein